MELLFDKTKINRKTATKEINECFLETLSKLSIHSSWSTLKEEYFKLNLKSNYETHNVSCIHSHLIQTVLENHKVSMKSKIYTCNSVTEEFLHWDAVTRTMERAIDFYSVCRSRKLKALQFASALSDICGIYSSYLQNKLK